MRCTNPECLKVMRCPSDKTKETGLCGECRKKIEREGQNKPSKLILKLRPKGRRKQSAIEKFEESLKDNPEYQKFVNMFRTMEKLNVRSV